MGFSFLGGNTSEIWNLFEDMKDPTGFLNTTDSAISFNNGIRTLSISPTSGVFTYYFWGIKKISFSKSVQIPNITGSYYFYIDSNDTLQYTTVFDISILYNQVYVANVSWDAINQKRIYFGEERHSAMMDYKTHILMHQTSGSRYAQGLDFQNILYDQTGSLDAHAQFSYTSGKIYDEDIELNIGAGLFPALIPIFYKIGSEWKRKEPDVFPFVYSGDTTGYVGANGRIAYNEEVSVNNFKLSEIDLGNIVMVHYFATNDIDFPLVGFLGQVAYGTIANARTSALTEIKNIKLMGMPILEFTALGTVLFQTAVYSNTPNARIRSISTSPLVIFEDWKGYLVNTVFNFG